MALNKSKSATAAKKAPAKAAASGKAASGNKASTNGKAGDGPSDKNAFLALTKNAANVWKKAREAEPREGGGFVDLPAGNYLAQVTKTWMGGFETERTEGRVTKKVKLPQVKITMMITEGDHKGSFTSWSQILESDMSYKILAQTLQVFGYETKKMGDLKPAAEALEEIGKEKPNVRIGIGKKEGKDHSGAPKTYINVYINEILDGSGNGTDTTADNQEAEMELEEGMEVIYNDEPHTVSKIIEDDGEVTVNLKDADGKKVNGIDPSKLSLPEESND